MNRVMFLASMLFGATSLHFGFRDGDIPGIILGCYLMFSATEWRKE